jgi:hypothetical protein
MDPTPIVDGIVAAAQSNPKTAAFLALIPTAQVVARFALIPAVAAGIKATQREHSTWLNRGLRGFGAGLAWFTRWPGPK